MKAQNVFNKIAQNGRKFGFPKDDVERVMTHYNVDKVTAIEMIRNGKAKLPPRGTKIIAA